MFARLSLSSLIELCHTLRHYLGAGLSLEEVFRNQAIRGKGALRPICARVALVLKRGHSLDSALEAEKRHFPPMFLAMVRVGELTGMLPEVFADLERYFQQLKKLRGRFFASTAWPFIQFFMAVCVLSLVILVMDIIPPAPMPNGERYDPLGFGLFGVSGALTFIGVLVGGLFAIVFAFWLVGKLLPAAFRDRVLLMVPLVGGALRDLALMRFCLALRLTTETGMSIHKAIRLALESTGNAAFAAASPIAERTVKEGDDLTLALMRTGRMPDDFLRIIQVAEESGRLSEVLRHQGEHYTETTGRRLLVLTFLLSLLVWIGVAAMIIFFIIRMFMSYIRLLDSIMPWLAAARVEGIVMAKKKMSQDRAFLDDIGANPDDDGPRLIYADWLEDQGQAHRAEFIRLQCRLARMSDWDPDRLALERRERDLLCVYGDQWAWVLPTWARDTHRRHPFRRGFPDVVSTTASKFLQSGASLLDAVPIGGVRLRAVNDHWRELADSPLLGRISSLSFFGAQIEEEELSTLLRSPNSCGLRSLSLEYTGVGLAEMRVLAKWEGLPRLRWLDLSGNRGVDGHALSELATGSFDSLEWLRLGNIPGVAEAPALAACAPRLTHLDLSRTDAGADWFARLATAAPTLASLALTVPSDGVGTVLDSPLISQLESLTVNGYVSAETLQRLVRPASPARLRRLAIRFSPRAEGVTGAFAGGVSLPLTSLQSGGKLGPADIEGLASSPQLAGLRRLHLGGNPIGDAGVRALLTSPHLRALEILDLSLCEIGLASAGALAESPNLSRLRELRLHITDIGTAGVEALAGSANLRNLHGLSLGLGEGLSLKAVRALARSPHLRELRWLHVGRTGKAEEQMEKELSNPERLPRLLELNENRPQWLRERPHNL